MKRYPLYLVLQEYAVASLEGYSCLFEPRIPLETLSYFPAYETSGDGDLMYGDKDGSGCGGGWDMTYRSRSEEKNTGKGGGSLEYRRISEAEGDELQTVIEEELEVYSSLIEALQDDVIQGV